MKHQRRGGRGCSTLKTMQETCKADGEKWKMDFNVGHDKKIN